MTSLTADRGYISSDVTQRTQCGSTELPWRINVPSGKTVRIQLYDFQALQRAVDANSDPSVCQMYAVIREQTSSPETVCGSRVRETYVYTSTTNQVDVMIHARSRQGEDEIDSAAFLLYYEGM